MKYLIIISFIVLLSSIVIASDCKHTETSFNCVEYVKNYDGDTITFNIPNVHPLIGKNMKIRVSNIDTAEIRGKNECEKRLAKKAKKFVKNLLKNAKRVELKNIQRGKYFRIVADVVADKVNVGDVLLEKRLAVRYDGGKKRSIDWCK